MEKCLYFWLDYIVEYSTLLFSANNGKVFVLLVKLYRGVFHPIIFSLTVNFLSLQGWEGDWSPASHIAIFFVWGLGRIAWCIAFLLQTESAGGNCLFAAIKASMNVHHSNSKDAPYYPTRYFRRQVVAWMIKHCQLVMANKGVALMANYGLEEEEDQFKGPLSYKQYLWACTPVPLLGRWDHPLCY